MNQIYEGYDPKEQKFIRKEGMDPELYKNQNYNPMMERMGSRSNKIHYMDDDQVNRKMKIKERLQKKLANSK